MLLQHYIFDTLLLNFAIFLIIIKIVLFLSINIFIIGRYGNGAKSRISKKSRVAMARQGRPCLYTQIAQLRIP